MKEEYSKENILVVDDNLQVGQVVAELLSKLGFKVDSEISGKRALLQIRNKTIPF